MVFLVGLLDAINRMATLPPALIHKIEQLRRRTLESRVTALNGTEPVGIPSQTPAAVEIPTIEHSVSPGPSLPPPRPPSVMSVEIDKDLDRQNSKGGKDDEIRRKAERRKRAALFLEKMRAQAPVPISCDAPDGMLLQSFLLSSVIINKFHLISDFVQLKPMRLKSLRKFTNQNHPLLSLP